MGEIKHPVNLLTVLVSLAVLYSFECNLMSFLFHFLPRYFAVFVTLTVVFLAAIVLAPLMQLFFTIALGMPCTQYLLASRDFFGNYVISLNLPGFLSSDKNNKRHSMMAIRKSLFELIKKIDPERVKDGTTFTFETWILNHRDVPFLESLGFEIKEIKQTSQRFYLYAVYLLVNRKRPNFRNWRKITFNKVVLKELHKNFSDFGEINKLRIKRAQSRNKGIPKGEY